MTFDVLVSCYTTFGGRDMIKMTKDLIWYGKRIRADNQHLEDITNAWQELMQKDIKVPLYGVYNNFESDFNGAYDFMIATTNQGLVGDDAVALVEGNYEIFHGDNISEVGAIWNTIWTSDLNRAYTTDFEEYHADGSVDVYISVVL